MLAQGRRALIGRPMEEPSAPKASMRFYAATGRRSGHNEANNKRQAAGGDVRVDEQVANAEDAGMAISCEERAATKVLKVVVHRRGPDCACLLWGGSTLCMHRDTLDALGCCPFPLDNTTRLLGITKIEIIGPGPWSLSRVKRSILPPRCVLVCSASRLHHTYRTAMNNRTSPTSSANGRAKIQLSSIRLTGSRNINNNIQIMSSDDPGFKAALAEAAQGLQEGGIPIGACLVDKDGKVLGRGHNMRIQKSSAILHVRASFEDAAV